MSLLRSMVMQDWVVVVKVRAVDLLNSVEFKMVLNLLLTTSWKGALTQLTSLAIVIDTVKV